MATVQLEIVPDPDDGTLALPFAEVTVGDIRVQALLDSGARRSSVVRHPGVTGSRIGATGRSAFGLTQSAEVAEHPVQFGGRDLGLLLLDIVPPGRPGHGNLIGQDVLGRFRCEYRLGEGLLILDGEAATSGHSVFLDEGLHVYAELRWPSGEVAQGVLDTGASVTVVDRTFVAQHPGLFVPDGASEGRDSAGATVRTAMMVMAPMTLLGSHFESSKVAVVDLSAANAGLQRPMDLIVGWPILSQGSFCIDHAAQRAWHRF